MNKDVYTDGDCEVNGRSELKRNKHTYETGKYTVTIRSNDPSDEAIAQFNRSVQADKAKDRGTK